MFVRKCFFSPRISENIGFIDAYIGNSNRAAAVIKVVGLKLSAIFHQQYNIFWYYPQDEKERLAFTPTAPPEFD